LVEPAGVIIAPAATNLPPLPVFQPRTELFREVLAMTAAQQEAWLTSRPPRFRPQLEAKIREYQTMTPEAREAALRATQLHEYLEHFINTPAANRSSQLAQVPPEYRAVVGEKLREFDSLPPELQKQALAVKTTADYFLNQGTIGAGAARPGLPPMPPPMPREPLSYLSRLSPSQRQEMYVSFQHFFDLDYDDRQKILDTLPQVERGSVEKTLRDLESLPQEQRDRGLRFISTLASMTDGQRQAFFKNAQLWQELPTAERQTWRQVAAHLPPLPPGLTPLEGPALTTNPPN
jgi:hypothetical protein